MSLALIFLLALYQMPTSIHCELDATSYVDNNLAVDDAGSSSEPHLADNELLDVLTGEKPEQAELDFSYPISNIGIDHVKNSLVLNFPKHLRQQRNSYLRDLELNRRENFMHYGKRQAEVLPEATGPGYYDTAKRSPSDFMRLGRSPSDFMRLGRSPSDFMRLGRSPSDFMRLGRSPSDFMRLGRSSSDFMRLGRSPADFMRLGRSPADFMRLGRSPSDFMRLGRTPSDFMRLGRSPSDFMRLGRGPSDFMRLGRSPTDQMRLESPEDFMRLGRSPADFMRLGRDSKQNFMRFGRSNDYLRWPSSSNNPQQDFVRYGRPDNFMRFGRSSPTTYERLGKMDGNFMRFGKSINGAEAVSDLASSESNQTNSQLQQSNLPTSISKPQGNDDNNPVDKAITMLFSKQHHEGHQQQEKPNQEEQQQKSSEQTDLQNNLEDGSVEQFYEP